MVKIILSIILILIIDSGVICNVYVPCLHYSDALLVLMRNIWKHIFIVKRLHNLWFVFISIINGVVMNISIVYINHKKIASMGFRLKKKWIKERTTSQTYKKVLTVMRIIVEAIICKSACMLHETFFLNLLKGKTHFIPFICEPLVYGSFRYTFRLFICSYISMCILFNGPVLRNKDDNEIYDFHQRM